MNPFPTLNFEHGQILLLIVSSHIQNNQPHFSTHCCDISDWSTARTLGIPEHALPSPFEITE